MKATPMFLGACAFASIAGALSGATTNTVPIRNGGIGMDMLPERAIASAFDRSQARSALPDHYPVITPSGRIEVAELSMRGLYAQQRFAWRSENYAPVPEPAAYEEPATDWIEPSVPAIDAVPVATPVQPLDLSSPSSEGFAKTIDVAAALGVEG